jgi:plasmid maintenance system antidote protein VapI
MAQVPDPVETLFREAAAKYGTQRALAKALHTTAPNLHGMMTGTRPVSPETVCELCLLLEIEGDRCRQLVASAILRATKNADRVERLRQALFRCWVAGAAALLAGLGAAWTPSPARAQRVDGLYIVAHRGRWLRFGMGT